MFQLNAKVSPKQKKQEEKRNKRKKKAVKMKGQACTGSHFRELFMGFFLQIIITTTLMM